MTLARLAALAATGVVAVGAVLLAGPATVLAHALDAAYQSRLPLAVYLTGAAITVGLSFAFVLARDVRAEAPAEPTEGRLPPAPIRYGLRTIGLLAWLWIIAQGLVGGASDAEVATLFVWVFGWVGLAMVSCLLGPVVWHFLDPFSTLHDVGAWAVRRLGVKPWDLAEFPERLGRWPAVIAFLVIVWLELVIDAGPTSLFVVLVGYTALTLALMAQYGRDTWRTHGEVFTVWFRLLGRLGAYRLLDEDGRVARRSFLSGLLEGAFDRVDVVLVALGVGSILFDGLSQTQIWFELFGRPAVPGETVLILGFLALIVLAALAVTRVVGDAATVAGLLPIAAGYLFAHYLTYLLIDGQRIVIALSDPFQRGWDLLGFAFHRPTAEFLPPGLVWTVQLAAVVGGHMLGAWAGHVVAAREAPAGTSSASIRRRQVPLAIVMVALTTLTLWSLGQATVITPEEEASAAARPVTPSGQA